jgi:hypothetical protein
LNTALEGVLKSDSVREDFHIRRSLGSRSAE